MTIGGWIMLVVAWALIFGVTVWCLARVLRGGTRYDAEEPPVVPTA
ncbi:MAG: hypothetical protein ACREK5_12260 [Gemmatimonadota bacterium]